MLSRGLVCFAFGFLAFLPLLACVSIAQEAAGAVPAEISDPAEVGGASPLSTHGEAGHDATEHHSDHAAGGHHGHSDPTTGGGKSLDSLMSFQYEKAVWSIVVFLLMLAGLWAVAWKPITEALEKRERVIANGIADAKNASEQALAKLKEYEAKLASATAEATEIVSQARKDAERAGQRIVADAQEEAARQRDRALADIESAKQNALSEMASRSTDMAFSLARRVVGRELNTSDHQQLIQDAVSKLPSRN